MTPDNQRNAANNNCSPLSGKIVCFRGELRGCNRHQAKRWAIDRGAKLQLNNDYAEADIVVVPEYGSEQAHDAEDKGVEVWCEAKFLAAVSVGIAGNGGGPPPPPPPQPAPHSQNNIVTVTITVPGAIPQLLSWYTSSSTEEIEDKMRKLARVSSTQSFRLFSARGEEVHVSSGIAHGSFLTMLTVAAVQPVREEEEEQELATPVTPPSSPRASAAPAPVTVMAELAIIGSTAAPSPDVCQPIGTVSGGKKPAGPTPRRSSPAAGRPSLRPTRRYRRVGTERSVRAGAGRYAPYPSAIQKRSREPLCSAATAPAPARKAPEDRPQKTRKKTSELLQPLVAAPAEPSAPPPHLLHGLGSLLEEDKGEPKARSAGGRTAALRKALSAAIDTVRLDPLALPLPSPSPCRFEDLTNPWRAGRERRGGCQDGQGRGGGAQ